MSETAALTACTACEASIWGIFSDSGVFALGSSTSTSPSQNAMRSRKNISCSRSSLPTSGLTILDKSEVIALGLIPGGSAKESVDLVRSEIFQGCMRLRHRQAVAHARFRNHEASSLQKPAVHHLCRMGCAASAKPQ